MEMSTLFLTKDYSIFNKLKGNRDIKPKRVKEIKDSIVKDGWLHTTIIVNENMEIIDGQARIAALRDLNMPVEYEIRKGYGIAECRALNNAGRTWTETDHIVSHAETGEEAFVKFYQLMEEYQVNVRVVTAAIHKTPIHNRHINTSFSLSDEEYMKARDILRKYKAYESAIKRLPGRERIKADVVVFMIEHGVDTNLMTDFLSKMHLDDLNTTSKETMLKSIQDSYNRNKKKKENRIYVYEAYRKGE